MNPYQTLEINQGASIGEVKKAYHKLAKQYHPDVATGSTEKFQAIQQAYDMLKDGKPHDTNINTDNLSDIINRMYKHHQSHVQTTIMANVEIDLLSMMTGCTVKINDMLVDIPAGAYQGQQLIFKGKGNTSNGITGDLMVQIRQIPHTNFARQNDHLLMKYEIDIIDALVGKEVEIEMLDKTTKKVIIHPNSNPNTIIAVNGLGFPNIDTQKRGNLYIHLAVRFRIFSDNELSIIKSLIKN